MRRAGDARIFITQNEGQCKMEEQKVIADELRMTTRDEGQRREESRKDGNIVGS